MVIAGDDTTQHRCEIATDDIEAVVGLETPGDDSCADPGFEGKPGFRLTRLAGIHRDSDPFRRATFCDDLGAAANNSAIPGNRCSLSTLGPGIKKAGIWVRIRPGRPQRKSMKIIHQRKNRRLVGIDFDFHLNLMRSRQGETDYDQKRQKSADSVDQLLHG